MSEQKSKAIGIILFIVILLIAIILIWGYVGEQEAKKVGVTCDMGVGTTFCWKWHTNAIGQLTEGIDDALNG